MKKCRVCNSVANDSENFCSRCENASFYFENNEDFQQPTQFLTYVKNVRGDRVQLVHNFDDNSQSQQETKSRKTKNLIGIFFAGILLLFALVTAIDIINEKVIKNMNDDYVVSESVVLYTKGAIVDGVYVNKWADIQFDLSEGWTQGNNKDYADIEDVYIDCGFYGKNGVNTLTISFIDTGNISDSELEEYLNEYASAVAESMKDSQITEPSFEIVGKNLYIHSKITGNIGVSDMIVSAFLRKLDERVILISVTGNDEGIMDSIIDTFK